MTVLAVVLVFSVATNAQSIDPEFDIQIDVLQTRSPSSYTTARAGVFSFVYSDREEIFKYLPSCLSNSWYVRTASRDKLEHAEKLFAIETTAPASVYVGFSQDAVTIPDWLHEDFELVEGLVIFSGPAPSEITVSSGFRVYKSKNILTRFDFGPNVDEGANSINPMYTVFVAPADADLCGGMVSRE